MLSFTGRAKEAPLTPEDFFLFMCLSISAACITLLWGLLALCCCAAHGSLCLQANFCKAPDAATSRQGHLKALCIILQSRYGHGGGGIVLMGIPAIAMFCCGMSSLTSNSR